VYLAYIYWETGRPGPAIATLESALARGVTDATVRTRLGLYLAESGANPQRALKMFAGLPTTNNVEALNGLGVAYRAAGKPDEAMATFRKILTLDPTNGLAMHNIAVIQLEGAKALGARDPRRAAALGEAEATLRRALEADPQLPDAYTTLGVVFDLTGRPTEAIDSWKRAVDLDARNFDALYNLVIELTAVGRKDEAVRYGQRYLASAPPEQLGPEIAEIRRILGGGR